MQILLTYFKHYLHYLALFISQQIMLKIGEQNFSLNKKQAEKEKNGFA